MGCTQGGWTRVDQDMYTEPVHTAWARDWRENNTGYWIWYRIDESEAGLVDLSQPDPSTWSSVILGSQLRNLGFKSIIH